MKDVYLIAVGKLKSKEFEAIENDYLKRIKTPKLKILEVKAKAEDKNLEAKEVLKKIKDITKGGAAQIVLLSEWGKEYDSVKLSSYVEKLLEGSGTVFFILGGAEGHGDELLETNHQKLSLSKLTYPHKFARVLFVEQFYRAQTIRTNHPYHN